MKKREAKFTLEFRKWLKENPMPSSAFEIKQTTKESIPYDAVKEHQVNALLASKTKGLLYKIPDDSRSYKPFDCVWLNKSFAWVVIKYPKGFVIIDIETFLLAKEKDTRKSLTWKKALSIATIEVIY